LPVLAGARVDLHVHTTCSDGLFSPAAVVRAAAEAGLGAVAVTDHDSMEGVDEALRAAGPSPSLAVVPGVEISCLWSPPSGCLAAPTGEPTPDDDAGEEVHILGYWPDRGDPALSSLLARLRRGREERVEIAARGLQRAGVQITAEDIREESGPGAPGRGHMARLLVRRGYAGSMREAFHLYLTPGKAGYAPRLKAEPGEAVEILARSGALPVLAHPRSVPGIEELILSLVPRGLRGLEVIHRDHSFAVTRRWLLFARRHGLLPTGGSDFHGDDGLALGMGGVTAPSAWYRALEEARGRCGVQRV